jgi:hypothetical protein
VGLVGRLTVGDASVDHFVYLRRGCTGAEGTELLSERTGSLTDVGEEPGKPRVLISKNRQGRSSVLP